MGGKLQGNNFDHVKERWPEAWAAYMPLPAELGAEPQEDVKQRLESVFFDMAAQYPGKTVAVVIHGANGRCLLSRSIGNGSITTLQIGPGIEWHLREIGKSSHLPKGLDADAIKASKL